MNCCLFFFLFFLVRLRFLGKVLSVERASKLSEAQQGKESVPPTSLIEDASVTRDVGDGSKFRSFPASEPIAPRLGVDYPFPPHLEYVSLSVLRKLFYFPFFVNFSNLIRIFVSMLESSVFSVNAIVCFVMEDIYVTVLEVT
jgi:hypothetical protein